MSTAEELMQDILDKVAAHTDMSEDELEQCAAAYSFHYGALETARKLALMAQEYFAFATGNRK